MSSWEKKTFPSPPSPGHRDPDGVWLYQEKKHSELSQGQQGGDEARDEPGGSTWHLYDPVMSITPSHLSPPFVHCSPARTTPGTRGWLCPRTFALAAVVRGVCPLDWFCLFKQLLLASLSQGTFMSLLLVPTATSVLFHPKLSLICVYFLPPPPHETIYSLRVGLPG